MTRLLALPFALCLFAAMAVAQEIPGDSLGLIPEAPAPEKKPKPEPQKKSSTEQASDDLQARIRYREARTKALQDPRIQMEWDRAQAAKTDPEKREAMKSYYTLLCDRLVKIDPTTKSRVEKLRQSLAWRFETGHRKREKLAKPADEEVARIEAAEIPFEPAR